MERMTKIDYYLNLAKQVAMRGTCLRRLYGSVIVKDDRIVSTGYVGAPRGRLNCSDLDKCIRSEMSIPRGERYELCLSGSTLIRIRRSWTTEPSGYLTRIDDLYDELTDDANNDQIDFKKVDIISVDGKHLTYTPLENILYMGRQKCVTVKFTDDSTITCTPDHPFLMIDRSYREAELLKKNDDIMGYTYLNSYMGRQTYLNASIDDKYSHYPSFTYKKVFSVSKNVVKEHVYDLTVPATENFGVELVKPDSSSPKFYQKINGVFVHNCRSVHSEMNAIIQADANDLSGSTLYLVGIEVPSGEIVKDACCCSMCKRAVINAGIKEVITLNNDLTHTIYPVQDWVDNDESLLGKFGY